MVSILLISLGQALACVIQILPGEVKDSDFGLMRSKIPFLLFL